jgi:hypothetical protein
MITCLLFYIFILIADTISQNIGYYKLLNGLNAAVILTY